MEDNLDSLREELSGGVIVHWVLVAEWARADGTRGVGVNASHNTPEWTRDGLLHHALYTGADWEDMEEWEDE